MSLRAQKLAERHLRRVFLSCDGDFTSSCFSQLYSISNSPRVLHAVFVDFTLMVFQGEQISKKKSFGSILRAISHSKLLLDAFLCGLFEYDIQGCKNVTSVDQFLNQELCFMDEWMELDKPSLLNYDTEKINKFMDRSYCKPIDKCILEVLFSRSSPEEITRSCFIDVRISYVLGLNMNAKKNFVDALLIKLKNDPMKLMNIINSEGDKAFTGCIFRERENYEILTDVFQNVSVNEEYVKLVDKIYRRFIDGTKYVLGYFIAAVLPFADFIPDNIISTVINSDTFPSKSPNFPVDLFVKSEKCVRVMNFNVLFDICKNGNNFDLIKEKFNSNNDVLYLLDVILSSPYELVEQMKPLFIELVSKIDISIYDNFLEITEIHLDENLLLIINLFSAFMEYNESDIFLNESLLFLLNDYLFNSPKEILDFFSILTLKYYENESIKLLWKKVFPSIADHISSGGKYSGIFSEFLIYVVNEYPPYYALKAAKYSAELTTKEHIKKMFISRFTKDQE